MPLTMAAPVGMPVFGFSWANTRGMFWFFAAYWATAFTPKDQEAMFANRVMRNTTAMMTKIGGRLCPPMVITATIMPKSGSISSAGMAAPMPKPQNR